MKVRSILASKGTTVYTALASDTIHSAIERLRKRNIGALVVIRETADAGSDIQGIVTERDIVLGVATHGPGVVARPVADIMRHGDVCRPDDDVEFIMSRMTSRRVRHMIVVEDGALCGVISIGDVVKKQLQDMELEVNVLRDAYRAAAVS